MSKPDNVMLPSAPPTLSARALRVAMYGFVPADDPHIIADLQAKIESDAKVIAALRDALRTVKLYIADQMIAHAIVVPADAEPNERGRFNPKFPTLMQVVDKALGDNEQDAGK